MKATDLAVTVRFIPSNDIVYELIAHVLAHGERVTKTRLRKMVRDIYMADGYGVELDPLQAVSDYLFEETPTDEDYTKATMIMEGLGSWT